MDLFIIILLILVVMVLGFLFNSFLLHISTRIFKVENVKYKIAIKIVLISIILVFLLSLVLSFFITSNILLKTIKFLIYLAVLHKILEKYYKTDLKRNLKISLLYLFFAISLTSLLITIPFRLFVMEPFYVKGFAMKPEFNDGDYLFIKKFDKNYKKGDVVVYKDEKSKQFFIKRIIGLPGEKIQIKEGFVFVEGVKLDESYLKPNIRTEAENKDVVEIGNGQYYVLGDNREFSLDSRKMGPVDKSSITGKYWITSPLLISK